MEQVAQCIYNNISGIGQYTVLCASLGHMIRHCVKSIMSIHNIIILMTLWLKEYQGS